jgi:hypothetical protein
MSWNPFANWKARRGLKETAATLERENARLRDELAVCRAVLRGIAVQAEKVSRESRSKSEIGI